MLARCGCSQFLHASFDAGAGFVTRCARFRIFVSGDSVREYCTCPVNQARPNLSKGRVEDGDVVPA